MRLSQMLFDDLAKKYGRHASWAAWNDNRAADVSLLVKEMECLKTSVVMIGLNVSTHQPGIWENFHGRDHARKLMYAFNHSPYRGAYMTDLIKEVVEPNSAGLWAQIKTGTIDLQKQIRSFRTEMRDVGVTERSLFILFGKKVSQLFRKHLANVYPNYVSCVHYSMYGKGFSDAGWVEKTWAVLEAHSRETRATFNTLEFVRNDLMKEQLQKLMNNSSGVTKTTVPASVASE